MYVGVGTGMYSWNVELECIRGLYIPGRMGMCLVYIYKLSNSIIMHKLIMHTAHYLQNNVKLPQ